MTAACSARYGWQYINGSWYYLGGANDGSMKSGWQYINDYFYYLGNANDGAMKIGTQIIDGEEFYFHEDGQRSTIITQYADTTGSQTLFYTIETAQGALIVIDGGMSGNEEYVRKIIKEKGDFVDAWIITHPHPDHVGAFNSICSSVQDISISNIYTIEMDYEVYKQCARPWDAFDVYDTFYTLTKEADNIHYLHTGDELEVGGCGIKVYNAYDDNTIKISKDICNIGSLMFEVFGEQESMLFCNDVYGKVACDEIRDMYEEELDATYIQMGHHGNNTVTHEFIDLVSPEIAFFDAPSWLITDEQYDTQKNIDYLESTGATVYTYMSAPNRIFLK